MVNESIHSSEAQKSAISRQQIQTIGMKRRTERSIRHGEAIRMTGAAALVILSFGMAHASRAPKPKDSRDTAAQGAADQLRPVIVTAERRKENMQDVPVTVAAFSPRTLKNFAISKVENLQEVDSSLSISAQSGAVIPFIQGIGNIASQTPGNESSVAVYIDGAYYTRLYAADLALPADDIKQVEVLKGPQGTLFGRNATGGVIDIITRDPGQRPAFDVRVGYGSQNTWKGQMYAAGPISKDLAINLSVDGQRMQDGFGRNLYDGKPAYYNDFLTARTELKWTPTNSTVVRWSNEYVYNNSSIGTVQGGLPKGYTRGLPPNFTQQFVPPTGFYDVNVNFDTARRHRGYASTLQVNQGLSFADFESISFYRKAREPWTSEGDHTYEPWLQYVLEVQDNEFSQEFQLKSKPQSPVKWIFGLYYLDTHAAYNPTTITGDAITLSGLKSIVYLGRQTIVSKAAYSQATFPLFSKTTNGTVGIRYTKDNVMGFGENYAYAPGSSQAIFLAPNYRNGASFSRVTYKVAADHHFSRNVMGYVSYSTGYKSGVFNLLPLDKPAVPPETVNAYDVGVKTTLAQGRVRFNISGFWNDIAHFQTNVVQVIHGVATVQLANAEKARTRGVEFSLDALAARGLTLLVSGNYIDARFVKFDNAPIVTPIYSAPYGLLPGSGSASGNRLPQVPDWKFNVGINYEFDTKVGLWSISPIVSHRSGFPWEVDNVAKAPSLTLVNATIEFQPSNMRHIYFRLWGKNLTGVEYYDNVLSQTGPAGYLASPAPGRTFGVEFGWRL